MGNQITRRIACLHLGIAISGVVLVSPAQPAENDPAAFLQTLANDVIAVLSDGALDQTSRESAIRKLLRRGIDLHAVSRFVLGRYWRMAKDSEKKEFLLLFEDYLVAMFSRRLGKFSSEGLVVTGQREDGADGAMVHSRITPLDGPTIKLDWRLKLPDEGWLVVDTLVEGVSLAMTQRTEFASMIRNNGGHVEGLLAKLRKKSKPVALSKKPITPSRKTTTFRKFGSLTQLLQVPMHCPTQITMTAPVCGRLKSRRYFPIDYNDATT
jgi:phospholipid transport system substrate-binding protein